MPLNPPLDPPPTALPSPTSTPPNPTVPLLVGAFAAASFVAMDSVIKLMAQHHDALQLGFLRFAGGSVFAVLLWSWKRSPLPTRLAWRLHIARSLLLLVSLVGYFHALTQLPLAQAIAISYLSPIFVSVLAVPVLHERPQAAIWWALCLGLAGVSISVWPELRLASASDDPRRLLGMASAAVGALTFAGVMLLARRQSRSDSLWTILLVQNLLPMLLLAAPAAWTWTPLQPGEIALTLGAGALGTIGLMCLTYAFTHLEASRIAPLDYTSFVWAAGLGYLLFGEVPTLATAASATLIIAGCLLLLRR